MKIATTVTCVLLLTACAAPVPPAVTDSSSNPTPQVPVTATPAPPGLVPTHPPLRPLSLPTASPAERQAVSDTWLYLTAFQSQDVSAVDPARGHALHEIPVTGDQAGVAVAPDGTRLYIVDGPGDGQLRVFDTATWQVVHQEPVTERALLLGGNPISLSGDGRWLLLAHSSYPRYEGWISVFDTQSLQFQPPGAWQLPECGRPARLVGRPGHKRLYAACQDLVAALDADTLAPLWQVPAPMSRGSDLVLAPNGEWLYGMYPHVVVRYDVVIEGEVHGRIAETDLGLFLWDATTGHLVRQIRLSDQVSVPTATFGRGDAGYLAIAPDGARLYVAWEDRLWALATGSLQVTGELELPAPVDGMVLSIDGREMYLLPATAGDLRVRGHGLWTVDTAALKLVRRAADWPQFIFAPFMVAAPAPGRIRY